MVSLNWSLWGARAWGFPLRHGLQETFGAKVNNKEGGKGQCPEGARGDPSITKDNSQGWTGKSTWGEMFCKGTETPGPSQPWEWESTEAGREVLRVQSKASRGCVASPRAPERGRESPAVYGTCRWFITAFPASTLALPCCPWMKAVGFLGSRLRKRCRRKVIFIQEESEKQRQWGTFSVAVKPVGSEH